MAEIKISESEFRELYQKMTLKELAEHYNVKTNQVSKVAKTLGLKKPRGPKTQNVLTLE